MNTLKPQHSCENLPLFFYPTRTILVDDDSLLLTALGNMLKKDIAVDTFTSPKNCLSFFDTYQSLLQSKKFVKSLVDDEEYHAGQHTPMDVYPYSFIELINDSNRFNEVAVMVLDYSMPEMTGLQLAAALDKPNIRKLLLTGNPSSDEIIQAFNNKLINKYLNKSIEQLHTVVLQYIKELQKDFFRAQTAALLHILETEKKLPLSDPNFIAFFEDYCKKHKITEYYMADKNGSFLCIDESGKRSMLVIHTDHSLEDWLKLNEEERNNENQIYFDQVSAREKIPYFGMNKEAWEIDKRAWAQHFLSCQQFEGRERYFWSEEIISLHLAINY